ncbi:SusC/RagA family TonB-linked outer membrane protein [Pedobacter nutrimenti]|uniref:TonB-linked SusC/RagA family outer membrane protein n=1 Tax=Pedobacter nutrimenti TaxID=1241337 RepID=A0A318U848_9SPHI|nr:TonB-dependent receptor [Pedobacter nutrimenti]PYF70633.1 TonB-linked SusC/RagA family outer membrane protein [Pedobacter nutrimenti]
MSKFYLNSVKGLLFLLFIYGQDAFSQQNNSNPANTPQKVVTGTVVDEKGEPVPGVTVRLKGTDAIASTATNGKYKINLKGSSLVLTFSFIGYGNQEVNIGNRTVVNVTLKPSSSDLEEVMVIGYGTVKKKDLTGSVGSVNITDLQKAPVRSFDEALAGRIAGVQVSSNDGQPGSEGINIVIRGANSLTQNNGPLYVLDGFPMEGLETSAINPDDIESITVLKDASSTAIYGARGANGVIVIETKKGKAGLPVLSYSASVGFNKITKTIPTMDAYDFVRYAIEKSPLNGKRNYTPADLDPTDASYNAAGKTLEDYRNVRSTNWQDLLFRTGITQIHNLSLRGGTKDTKYSISGSLFDQSAIIINSGVKRYQGRVALDQTISRKLSAGINMNYSSNVSTGKTVSNGTGSSSSTSYLLYSVFGSRPVTGSGIDLEDELVDPEADLSNDYRINPVTSAKNEFRNIRSNSIITNAYASYSFTKNLKLKVQGGLNNRLVRGQQFYNSQTSRGTPLLPTNIRGVQGSVNFSETNVWDNENTLNYTNIFGKIHALDVVVGSSLQNTSTSVFGLESQLIPNELLGISGIDEGIPLPNTSQLSDSRLMSLFGRVNYNYKSRYYFSATYRADGSSRFARGNRWGYFPSAAVSWKMNEEKFMKNLAFVSESKIRLSYGSSGNNRVDDYAYLAALNFPIENSYSFNNGTPALGAVPASLSNNNLKWETTNSFDIGYDLALFKDRIEFTVDWYKKITNDLLLNANIPFTSGYQTAFRNVGKVQNTGLEFSLSTVNINSENFKWRSNFNISFNQNKVLALNTNEEVLLSNVRWDTFFNNSFLYVAKIGEPAAQFFGYIFDGVYQLGDFDQPSPGTYVLKNNIPGNGTPRANIKPGDIKYKDLNGDLEINSYDQTVIGRTLPKHIGGFSNDFTYKGFNLNVLLQWSYGNDIYNANRIFFEGGGRGTNINQFASYNDRWTPSNPSNLLPGVNGAGPNGVYSSRVLEDGSFLRLKTISLSYTLPKKISKSLKLNAVNFSVSAQNIHTWTKYSGMDPEVSVRNSALTPGFDFSAYPRARTVVFGLNVKF